MGPPVVLLGRGIIPEPCARANAAACPDLHFVRPRTLLVVPRPCYYCVFPAVPCPPTAALPDNLYRDHAMTALSVNLNKLALLRNSRGSDFPNVLAYARRFVDLGAHGITVHPRPDERHIGRQDALDLAEFLASH